MTYCNVNGQLIAAENAAISVQDRGFRYGDGAFETLRVHASLPYQYEWHMERLGAGLNALKIPFDTAKLQDYCRELIHVNAISNGILRIQITRGIGSRGYLPTGSVASFVLETSLLPPISHTPVGLCLSQYTKISSRALPVRYKLCQGINSTLARLEAAENECADALLINERGEICETSSGNIFWLKSGALYTPSLVCGVLEGSTRASVLRLSTLPVHEVEDGIDALEHAEAVCITNSVWPVLAVEKISPYPMRWDSRKLAAALADAIARDRAEYAKKYATQWKGISHA